VSKQNNKEGAPQASGLWDAAQAPETTAGSEVKEQLASGKRRHQSSNHLATVNSAKPQLIRIAPASPCSQWGVLTTPMLPARMTPIVPLQKRVKSPNPAQSLPHKLQFNRPPS
ncbi:hypothetical protein FRC11_012484, partial [Ceratobasidium sp. 423]